MVDFTREQLQIEKEKEERQAARETWAEELAEWKKEEDQRKEWNWEKQQRYKEAIKAWEDAKTKAQAPKVKFSQLKPKWDKLEGPKPRPAHVVQDAIDGQGQNNDSDEEESDKEEDSWLINPFLAFFDACTIDQFWHKIPLLTNLTQNAYNHSKKFVDIV